MIYIASKTAHSDKWKYLRDNFDIPIVSRWIDYGFEINDFNMLWKECLQDIEKAEYFILYDQKEHLKGALVELGYAFSLSNLKIILVNLDYSISQHEIVENKSNLEEALLLANVEINNELQLWLRENT